MRGDLDRASDRGRFAGEEATSPFVVEDGYFRSQRFDGTEERDGRRTHFAGWSRPLETYAMALEGAGLAITAVREPVPQCGDAWQHLQRWTCMPLFLWLKARPAGGP
jgi:hypothetical protein